MQRIVALVSFIGITACAGDGRDQSQMQPGLAATSAAADEAGDEDETTAVAPTIDSETLESKIVETDLNAEPSNVGDEISADSSQLPLELNKAVENWIDYFTVRDPERFRRFLERGEKYRGMITAVLKEQGVPTEIYYLAMIESGFATAAKSRAKAVGIWQFMKGTGKRYGLRIDSYVDERRDPMRATVAAALYLKDLHNVFQNWYLAMAAYNAGEGRIVSAIMRAKTRDFWEIARQRALPQETMHYIPKFLAATTVGHNLRKYGLEDYKPDVRPVIAPVALPAPVRLVDIANLSGIDINLLRELNPHLLKGMTPPGVRSYRVWVPRDQVTQVEAQSEKLASLRVKGLRAIAGIDGEDMSRRRGRGAATRTGLDGDSGEVIYHRVQRGDTLGKIAARYGTSIKTLRTTNKLRGHRLAIGSRLVVGQKSAPSVAESNNANAANSNANAELAGVPKRYRVQRGDSLDAIARRFNMSVENLKKHNRLSRNRIYAGQMLRIPAGEG